MLNKFFRGLAATLISPPSRALVAAGVSPNSLTILGFAVVVAGCWLVADGRLLSGGLVLVVGAVFDMLDGAVAKASGKVSPGGAFLDSTIDRLADALLFLAIFWQFLDREGVWSVQVGTGGAPTDVMLPGGLWRLEDQTGALLALAALVLGFLVSYIKARAEGLGFDCSVGVAERPERVVIPLFGLLFDQLVPALALLVLLSAITAVQRFLHVWGQARALKEPA